MHVSPAKHSYAWLPRKCDYRTDGRTDGQTDTGQSDPYVPLCFAGDTKTYFGHSCCVPNWCSHSVVFNLCLFIKNPGHLKNQFFLLYTTAWIFRSYLLSPLTLTCDTHMVLCKEMFHNVCRYEYLTFQTEIHLQHGRRNRGAQGARAPPPPNNFAKWNFPYSVCTLIKKIGS